MRYVERKKVGGARGLNAAGQKKLNEEQRVIKVEVKESRNRPGVAQRVSGVLGSQISMTLDT